MSEEQKKYLSKLIKHLLSTRNGSNALNGQYLKALKDLVRNNDEHLKSVFAMILRNLNKSDPNIRIRCVDLSDYLFNRSFIFRELLLQMFTEFLELTVGLNGSKLPGTPEQANQLKTKSVMKIAQWNDKYGSDNKKLRLAYNFLQRSDNDGKLFTYIDEKKRSEEERRIRISKIRNQQYETMAKKTPNLCLECTNLVNEMDRIFEILVPKLHQIDHGNEQGEMEETHVLTNKEVTLEFNKEHIIDVAETEDNSVLFQEIRERAGVLKNRIYPQICKQVVVLQEAEIGDQDRSRERETFLELALDSKNKIETALAMCDDLGVFTEEDEIMVEVPLLDNGKGKLPERKRNLRNDQPLVSIVSGVSEKGIFSSGSSSKTLNTRKVENDGETSVLEMVDDDSKRKGIALSHEQIMLELLELAPFIEYGDDLYWWDKEKVPFNQTGLEFHHRFLGDGTGDNMLSQNTVDALKKRKFYYYDIKQNENNKLKVCRYPLKGGKICPRLHSEECTYHGVIVPRDEQGNRTDGKHDVVEVDHFKLPELPKKKSKKQELSTIESIKKKIGRAESVKRVAKEVGRQDAMKLRDRQLFKW